MWVPISRNIYFILNFGHNFHEIKVLMNADVYFSSRMSVFVVKSHTERYILIQWKL